MVASEDCDLQEESRGFREVITNFNYQSFYYV